MFIHFYVVYNQVDGTKEPLNILELITYLVDKKYPREYCNKDLYECVISLENFRGISYRIALTKWQKRRVKKNYPQALKFAKGAEKNPIAFS